MSSDTIEIPPTPRFSSPFSLNSLTDSTDDHIIMDDHQHKVVEWTSLGKKRGLRKRAFQKFFGLTHSRFSPQPDDQVLQCGHDRSPKQRSDEAPTDIVNVTLPNEDISDEELKKVVVQVESLLMKKLLNPANDIDSMIQQANTTFGYLKMLDVDYDSFYKDVDEYIKHHCNLQDSEREKTRSSFLALQKDYENASSTTTNVWEDFCHTQGEWEKAKEKKETLNRKIRNLKNKVAYIENEEERLKHDGIKYKEVYEISKAKMKELGSQINAKLSEIEQRKNAALQGIESTTQRLQSRLRDNLS